MLGDWDQPYLTMDYGYEAVIAQEFHRFLLFDMVVRHKKPVYWCPTCCTALAEAEVEYYDHVSPSIYVKFPVQEDISASPVPWLIFPGTSSSGPHPWTLRQHGSGFHPDFVYAAVQCAGEIWILAEETGTTCLRSLASTTTRS